MSTEHPAPDRLLAGVRCGQRHYRPPRNADRTSERSPYGWAEELVPLEFSDLPTPQDNGMNATEHDWRRNAACTSHHPELFFPIGTAGPALAQQEQARQICRGCPVRLACLEWAINVGADHGIWGGLSEQERQSLRRR